MKALIDADSLLYIIGFAMEESVDWDDDGNVQYWGNVPQQKKAIEDRLESILFATGCDDYELHLTGSKNFRHDNPLGYKENRTDSRKPAEFDEMKQWMIDELGAILNTDIEADDMVVYLKNKYPDDYFLVAQDKDVLYQSEGTHYNYNKDELVEVSKEMTIWFRYYQCLIGDTVDGYIGCKGIGKTKAVPILGLPSKKRADIEFLQKEVKGSTRALAIIPDLTVLSEKQLWIQTILTYRSKGFKLSDAINTMRLADMHQYNGKEVVLFQGCKSIKK